MDTDTGSVHPVFIDQGVCPRLTQAGYKGRRSFHMRSLVIIRRLILLGAMLALPAMAFAQDAVLTGTITDSTGAVLPGVTVAAVNEASGNNYEAVTDARGVYRVPVRVGSYKITAQLAGFGNVTRTGVGLLVGQTIT